MTTHSQYPRRGFAELPDDLSARFLLSRGQRRVFTCALCFVPGLLLLHAAFGAGPSPLWWAQAGVALMTACYVLVIAFRTILVLAASGASVLRFTGADLDLADEDLPTYTVLVPLHHERAVLPALIQYLTALDYPLSRLRVLLLIESDDRITETALESVELGPQFEIMLIPSGGPRTKPNACDLGLTRLDSELCVVYDAEDRPEPDQLRKAVAAFLRGPRRLVCVQAELAYWNPWTNWLTRTFSAEYALNFALTLRGLDRLGLPLPLGGTSNHFRVAALREVGGWDPYNVTEDADLGIRIARKGWRVRMMESITWEEANSAVGNWIRQRSRWIKGYLQTWLVHMRHPMRLFAELGPCGFVGFQLSFALSSLTILANPVFWVLFGCYLVQGPERIAPLYPPWVLYSAVAAMIAGNLITMSHFMIACMGRDLHRAVPAMLLVPVYWILMSLAAYRAVVQLLRPSRRHYWELTRHGLVADTDGAPVRP